MPKVFIRIRLRFASLSLRNIAGQSHIGALPLHAHYCLYLAPLQRQIQERDNRFRPLLMTCKSSPHRHQPNSTPIDFVNSLGYLPSTDPASDFANDAKTSVYTIKPLPRVQFNRVCSKIGLRTQNEGISPCKIPPWYGKLCGFIRTESPYEAHGTLSCL